MTNLTPSLLLQLWDQEPNVIYTLDMWNRTLPNNKYVGKPICNTLIGLKKTGQPKSILYNMTNIESPEFTDPTVYQSHNDKNKNCFFRTSLKLTFYNSADFCCCRKRGTHKCMRKSAIWTFLDREDSMNWLIALETNRNAPIDCEWSPPADRSWTVLEQERGMTFEDILDWKWTLDKQKTKRKMNMSEKKNEGNRWLKT